MVAVSTGQLVRIRDDLSYATLTALTCLVSDQCREIDKGLSETQQLGNLSLAFLVLPVSGLSTEVFRYVATKKSPFFLRNICLHCMIRMDVCVYVCKNAFDSMNICTFMYPRVLERRRDMDWMDERTDERR